MSKTLALFGGSKAVTMTTAMEEANRWPVITEEARALVNAAMDGPDLYASTAVFEKEFAAYHQTTYALAHNNGTSAIQAGYFAAGVQPGDEVLVPAYTWHLGVSQILTLHAIPVFCDIDPLTGCIDPRDIKRKLSPYTRAINVTHAFGAVAPMDEIMAIAREHGVAVIEDCSHAHGAVYKGRKVGTIGDVGCFSLQGAKLMTALEGGILITDNQEYFERAVLLGHYDRVPQLKLERYRKFAPDYPGAPTSFGYKYRMHPWAAAMAREQLIHLDERNSVRNKNLEYVSQGIRDLDAGLIPPPQAPGTCRTYLNYICQYQEAAMDGITRDRFVEALNAEGLPASAGRAGYTPVYWNALYQERNMWAEGVPFDSPYTHRRVEYGEGTCPEAEKFWQRTVGLPSFPQPCDRALLDQCIEAIGKVVRNRAELAS